MNPIQSVNVHTLPASLPALPVSTAALPGAESATPGSSFKELLVQGLDQVNSMQKQADVAIQQLVTGEESSPAEVLVAVQKADMAFRMMMQIRNKLVQAYQEIQEVRI